MPRIFRQSGNRQHCIAQGFQFRLFDTVELHSKLENRNGYHVGGFRAGAFEESRPTFLQGRENQTQSFVRISHQRFFRHRACKVKSVRFVPMFQIALPSMLHVFETTRRTSSRIGCVIAEASQWSMTLGLRPSASSRIEGEPHPLDKTSAGLRSRLRRILREWRDGLLRSNIIRCKWLKSATQRTNGPSRSEAAGYRRAKRTESSRLYDLRMRSPDRFQRQ